MSILYLYEPHVESLLVKVLQYLNPELVAKVISFLMKICDLRDILVVFEV